MTKLDQAVPTPEPTPLQPPLMMQPEPMGAPVEQGRDSIIFSANSLGECAMINVNSPNCIGSGRWFGLSE
jgi:hypothetical protein